MSRTVLITGCSSGIGRTAAKLFQSRGWNVAATMRSPEAENELGELDDVWVTRLDVTDSKSIEEAVAGAIDRFGGIDVLVNNAGYGAFGALEVTPREKIVRQLETNVVGVMETIKAVTPHFRSRKSGTIVNVSSVGGRVGGPLGSLYHASKFAVEGLSEALCFEMAAIGVRVKLVEPGLVETDFNGRSIDLSNEPAIDEYQGIIRTMLSGTSVVSGKSGGDVYRASTRVPAEDIYAAASESSDRLRYPSGEDAHEFVAIRNEVGDEAHLKEMLGHFGLSVPTEA